MTDKPIHEMRLADYQRGIANMERKRQPEVEPVLMNVSNQSNSPLVANEQTLDGRKMIRMMISEDFARDIAKNGDIAQKVRFPRVCEQGPEIIRFGLSPKFDGPA